MILISSNEADASTNHVIRWLYHYKKPFIRINSSTQLKVVKIESSDLIIVASDDYKNITFNLKDITSYWYRRGFFNLEQTSITLSNDNIENEINKHLRYENETVEHYLMIKSKNINSRIGHISFNYTNKIENLDIAHNSGFLIPATLVTSRKKILVEWVNKLKKEKKKIISKALNMPLILELGEKSGRSYTSVINDAHLEKLPDNFAITLFQEQLDKEFEIRTFFLNGKTYSMAIFSQNDEQTKIDFRRYNSVKPNRCSRFELPRIIDAKIRRFMSSLGLNSGSLDIIYTKKGEYFFLEVNPVGQFGMVSYPTNYKLERLIAQTL